MPPEFDRPHIDVSEFATSSRYRSPSQNVGGGHARRIREEHGAILREQLRASFREDLEERERTALPDDLNASGGAYYEIELRPGAKAEKLERKRQNIAVGATKIDPLTDRVSTVVFIPDVSIPVLETIFEDYATGERTPRGENPHNSYVEPIESIRRARLFSFWTDDAAALPPNAQDIIWWEVWCTTESLNEVVALFQCIERQIADEERWLRFPEAVIVPVLARRTDIELVDRL